MRSISKACAALCASLAAASCAAPRGAPAPVSAGLELRTIADPEPRRVAPVLGLLLEREGDADRALDAERALLADLLAAELASRGGAFKLVERERLERVYHELSLGDVGPVDQATAARIGGLLGANVLALGSLSRAGGERIVSVRLVRVETGEVLAGVSERAGGPSRLDAAARLVAGRLAAALASAR